MFKPSIPRWLPLNIIANFVKFWVKLQKEQAAGGFCEVLWGGVKKNYGEGVKFFYGNGVKKIYGEGVKGLRRDLLIGYEHWLIAAQYSPP